MHADPPGDGTDMARQSATLEFAIRSPKRILSSEQRLDDEFVRLQIARADVAVCKLCITLTESIGHLRSSSKCVTAAIATVPL